MPDVALPFVEERVARNAGTGSLDAGGRASTQTDRDITAAVDRSRWTGLLPPVARQRRELDCGDDDDDGGTSLNVEDLRKSFGRFSGPGRALGLMSVCASVHGRESYTGMETRPSEFGAGDANANCTYPDF